jgi:hypothetical protein
MDTDRLQIITAELTLNSNRCCYLFRNVAAQQSFYVFHLSSQRDAQHKIQNFDSTRRRVVVSTLFSEFEKTDVFLIDKS